MALCLLATQCAQDQMSGMCGGGGGAAPAPKGKQLQYKWDGSLTNKCVDVRGGNHVVGAELNLYDCSGDGKQHFVFKDGGPIQSETDPTLCFDAGVAGDATKVTLQKCNGSPEQKWTTNPRMQLMNGKSPGKCLDNYANGRTNGNSIVLWDCTAPTNVWKYGV